MLIKFPGAEYKQAITEANTLLPLTYLIRPIKKEFNDFILTLDKVLSENINRNFFKDEIELEKETIRKDGKIVVSNKGTIQLLDEWMLKVSSLQGNKDWEETIKTLKFIRLLRQKPAHIIEDDIFDNKFFIEQRELSIKAYEAISFIRMIFERFLELSGKQIEIPDWIKEGKIYAY